MAYEQKKTKYPPPNFPGPEKSTGRDAIFSSIPDILSTSFFYPSVHPCHTIAAVSRPIHGDGATGITARAVNFVSYTKSPASSQPDVR